jgi:dimethylglycine dehydrogenase
MRANRQISATRGRYACIGRAGPPMAGGVAEGGGSGAARATQPPETGTTRRATAGPEIIAAMRDQYRVVIIGGGIVGTSAAYHLALRGITDILLVERDRLTAGSSWHAAGGFHAFNPDRRIADLQRYTIERYPLIEAESGQALGMKLSGGIELAGTAERFRLLRGELSHFRAKGDTQAHLLTPDEAAKLVPIVNPKGLHGALFLSEEGNLDPVGATMAYATAAKARGVEIVQGNRVTALARRKDGGWTVTTEKGDVIAEHVVNAAGLWARRVGRMAGVEHPVTPFAHHYLVTDEIPEIAAYKGPMPAVTDLEGFTYLHREGNGVVLGVYETDMRHWSTDGAPWDFGMQLLPEEIDRISPELQLAFERFPSIAEAGVKRWVCGPFTATPDGNPLVGPIDGVPGYWAACGVFAGFSQCAGVGLVLANWIVDGDPGMDAFGMDPARFGAFAANDSYLLPMTAQFYARRFVIAYPNEELPAARPLKTTPAYERLAEAGARHSVNWGLEAARYVATDQGFEEAPTFGRSEAERYVAAEVRAVRSGVGAFEIAQYARYEVSGSGAAAWLDHLVAGRLPAIGRIRLAPMLDETGHLAGDLSIARQVDGRFLITGSYHLQDWHMRWFRAHLPAKGVKLRNRTDELMGFAISGPTSRDLLADLAAGDAATAASGIGFLGIRPMQIAGARAQVGRIGLTGELGYEIVVPAGQHLALYEAILEAGRPHGLRIIGDLAFDSLRLEKGYGIWSAEFRHHVTPAMCGLDRFVAPDKGDFIGREAYLRAAEAGPDRRLVLLRVDADDADAGEGDPIRADGVLVGEVTSGGFGHHIGMSLALAYVDAATVAARPPLTVEILGDARPAAILPQVPYDPAGARLRA